MSARITIGNAKISGFVNLVSEKRFLIGTGSYTNKNGDKVFKESITIFIGDNYAGPIPEKGKYVEIIGDLSVSNKDDKLSGAMTLRAEWQVNYPEAPGASQKKSAPSSAEGDDFDDI